MKILFTIPFIFIISLNLYSQVNPKENYKKGLESYYQARFSDAIGYFDYYINGYPGDYKGYMYKGLCFCQLKQNQNAIEEMGKALQLQPMNSEVLTYMGYIKIFSDMNLSGLEDFKNAVKSDLQNIHAHIGKGIAEIINNNFGLAINDFNSAEALQIPSYWLYINKGLAYSFLRDTIKAWECFSTAVDLDPNNSLVSTTTDREFDRNLIFLQFNIINSVISRLNELINLSPDYFEYYFTRAFFYITIRKFDLAESDLNKAIELHIYENPTFVNLAKKLGEKIKMYK